jgi:hypothetical protein
VTAREGLLEEVVCGRCRGTGAAATAAEEVVPKDFPEIEKMGSGAALTLLPPPLPGRGRPPPPLPLLFICSSQLN